MLNDLSFALMPLDEDIVKFARSQQKKSWGTEIMLWQEGHTDIRDFKLALIGVPEYRNSSRSSDSLDPVDKIRKELYRLVSNKGPLDCLDLGNIGCGETVRDTYVMLEKLVRELISSNVVPIIIGGSQDLTLAQYKAYNDRRRAVNLVVVDEQVDLAEEGFSLKSDNYLNHIFSLDPGYLYHFTHLASQAHYVLPGVYETLDKLSFEVIRLGRMRENFTQIEPVIRDADLISFDIAAIRASDAPGQAYSSPNGLFGEEACRIMRYAGLSDKVSSVGLYEYDARNDISAQTAALIAQMIWYFADGFHQRRNDYPTINADNFVKHIVVSQQHQHELIFWKSQISGRWWIEVPFRPQKGPEGVHLVPCNPEDYEAAMSEDIPEKWIRAWEKLS